RCGEAPFVCPPRPRDLYFKTALPSGRSRREVSAMSNEKAVMTFVPAPYRGKVLARGNQIVALSLFLFQVVLSIAVSAVPALLGAFLALSGKVFPNDKNLSF